jgi:Tfp pilus assembly protein PilO
VFRRVLTEQRTFIVLLAVALAINAAVYAAVVYPLASRVADADNRAAAAERSRRAAEREHQAATGLATSKERAEVELAKFYRDVLPADVDAAQRLNYLKLAQLARASNLQVLRRTWGATEVRGSTLDELKMTVVLEGQYEDMRSFIYKLETAPEFVVIADLMIDQGREAGNALVLTLQLSTYFRASNDAS